MPDIAKVFKEEIARIAKKEVKASVDPLKKHNQEMRKTISEQKRRIADLERQVSKLVKKYVKTKIILEPSDKIIRVNATWIKNHRKRLKLSQREMGLLLDVSSQTIIKWEAGAGSPRGANRESFGELRGMGIREVKERLGEMQ